MKRKKIFAALLAFCLIGAAFCGCGNLSIEITGSEENPGGESGSELQSRVSPSEEGGGTSPSQISSSDETGGEYEQPLDMDTGFDAAEMNLERVIERKDSEGRTVLYYPCEQSFTRWEDFYNTMTGIFTEEYFDRLNDPFGDDAPCYLSVEGQLYSRDIARGTNPTYTGIEHDAFALTAQNEGTVAFDIIALYDNLIRDDPSPAACTKRHPVVLRLTEKGWRVESMELPY